MLSSVFKHLSTLLARLPSATNFFEAKKVSKKAWTAKPSAQANAPSYDAVLPPRAKHRILLDSIKITRFFN